MFVHIFKTRLKCLIRQKDILFWTLLFPILLGTFFSMAFSNLTSADNFKTIPVAIVNNAEYQKDTYFKAALESDNSGNGGKKLFDVEYVSEEQADSDLKNNKIKGYILFENGPRVVFRENGMDQTILKQFVDTYIQYGSAVTKVAQENHTVLQNLDFNTGGKDIYKEVAPGRTANPNSLVIYFYALISMAAFYGGFWGTKEVTDIQANLSARGARLNLAPVHKLKTFSASFPAAVVIHFGAMLILIAYLALVLKVDFGGQLPCVILTCFVSSTAGVTFGAFIGVFGKSENLKAALVISITMLCSFLSGLMEPTVRYAVTNAVPLLQYINPANLITDAFYSLYYYTSYTRFFMNIGLLAGFSVLFYLGVYFVTRRQKYASI